MSDRHIPTREDRKMECLRLATNAIMTSRFTHDYEDIQKAIMDAAKSFEAYVFDED